MGGRLGSGTRQKTGEAIPLRRTAMVLGDGRVMPIVESLGRRMLREIDPLSPEGRRLLNEGRVTLCYQDGVRFEARPIRDVLDDLQAITKLRRDAHAGIPGWSEPHDTTLRSIGRMRRMLRPRPRG